MKEIYLEIKNLVYPIFCVICSKPGSKICLSCNSPWMLPSKKAYIKDLPLYFVGDYGEEISTILLLAKEHGNKVAIEILSLALIESIKHLICDKKISQPLNIVPIPSISRAIRRRGRDHINFLCIDVVEKLRDYSIFAKVAPILVLNRKIKDQSRLNQHQRIQNLKNAYSLKGQIPTSGDFILLDDVATTGSSLVEGARALSAAKIAIQGAVTACAVGRNSLIR